MVKFELVVPEISEQTDRQTDIQTDMHTTYSYSHHNTPLPFSYRERKEN